jgi:hypothetical protein
LRAAEKLTVTLHCPNCGQGIEKTIAWLAENSTVSCEVKGCFGALSLKRPDIRVQIEELSDVCERFDAMASTINKLA